MDDLKDPKKDRVAKQLPSPPQRPLASHVLFRPNNEVDWQVLRDHLKREGRIAATELIRLLDMVSFIVSNSFDDTENQPNLISVSDPVTIVGDIHGQYYDFLKLLEISGSPDETKYLFLGDYVDRGSFSVECMLLLLALKANFPKTVTMLRGNHECRQMTSHFNFRSECLSKYNQDIYDRFIAFFNLLPAACLLNGKFFCVHGGISPDLTTLDEIKKIDRFKEIPKNGVFCDLMWSDPVESNDGHCEGQYRHNDVRGCSYFFGYELAKTFLQKNRLISIIRAHEAQQEGYKMYKWKSSKDFPTVITIFSAPNYCDVYNNKGAVIKFVNDTLNIQQFNYTAHPYLLPNFMDVFTWSIPFVAEKVTEMLHHIMKPGEDIPPEELAAFEMTDKLKLLESILELQKTERQKNIDLVQMEGMCPDNKLIESGVVGRNAKKYKGTFEKGKSVDLKNQMRPENE